MCLSIQGSVHKIVLSNTGPSTHNHDFQYRAQYTKLCFPAQDTVHKKCCPVQGPIPSVQSQFSSDPNKRLSEASGEIQSSSTEASLKTVAAVESPVHKISINSTEASTPKSCFPVQGPVHTHHDFQYRAQYRKYHACQYRDQYTKYHAFQYRDQYTNS